MRVLVAEDETVIRLDLEGLLQGAGFDVVAAARDGEEAVELARSECPDLAILDVKMPRLDGIDAARRILHDRPIPIVMLTAYDEEDLVARAIEVGVFAYLVKPFREQDLVPAIHAARARFSELQALRDEADSLAEALEARKAIERAKGILMEKEGLTEAEAFVRLRTASQTSGRTMKFIPAARGPAVEGSMPPGAQAPAGGSGRGGRAPRGRGGARGLGRAIALALAEAGADVALGLRDVSRDGGLAAEIRALGRRALPLQMDVTRLDEVEAAVTATVDELGSLDVLVNNAGGGAGLVPAELVSVADFAQTVDVNLKGTFFSCRAAFAPMRDRGFGRIVNVSSQAALVALPGESVYCMTKAAVSHLTRCLAVEWGAHGINVNSVAPTFIRTPGTEPALSDPGFRADVEERIAALHRIGEPDDVAGAVVFLCSPAASLITGETLVIDGGWTAR